MPALYNYTITETREVKVAAENPSDAVALAAKAFAGKEDDIPDSLGRIRTVPETIRIDADKDF